MVRRAPTGPPNSYSKFDTNLAVRVVTAMVNSCSKYDPPPGEGGGEFVLGLKLPLPGEGGGVKFSFALVPFPVPRLRRPMV